jgi:uncharacterized membrane protein
MKGAFFMQNNNQVKKIAISGLVIAVYTVVMFFTQSFAFGEYQIRVATSLYAFASIYPFLVVPLGLANLLSNTLMGGFGLPDMLGGFIVGILTAGSCAYLRKISVYLTALPIIFFPAVLVPIWLSYLLHVPYLILAVSIGIGQIIPGILGVFLVKYLEQPLTGIAIN